MTHDPSMTITSTIPAPEGERQHQQRGQGRPLPVMAGNNVNCPGRTATRYGKDRWRYDL